MFCLVTNSNHNVHIKLFNANNAGDPSRMEIHRNIYAVLEDMNLFVALLFLVLYCDRPVTENH
jgi:hypothetical protein